MRVNIYAEEMTERIEIIGKEIEGRIYTGLRLYLELPVTLPDGSQAAGPFMHRPGDDDSAAITFWGKRDLRVVLRKMLAALDEHYGDGGNAGSMILTKMGVDALHKAMAVPGPDNCTSERLAIEHAEYMVQAGEHLISCMNSAYEAEQAQIGMAERVASAEEHAAADHAVERAHEAQGEAITTLRASIHEFRKQKDRAAKAEG